MELTDKAEEMAISQGYNDNQLSKADDVEESCGKVFEISIAKVYIVSSNTSTQVKIL